MKLQQLKYFVSVVESGAISAAARALHVAQPALSQQMLNLEQELGSPLLLRRPKGIHLTPAGEKLYHHAQRILRQVEVAKADILSGEENPRGKVNLMIDASKAYTLIPTLLRECQRRYPSVQLTVSDAMSQQAAEQLRMGDVDLALIPNAADIDDVIATPVYRESLYLIGQNIAADYPSGDIPFEHLSRFPLVLPSRSQNLRQCVEQAALKANRPLDIHYEQDTGLSLRCLTHHGIAHAIMPRDVMRAELQRGEVQALRIVAPEIRRIHAIARLESHPFGSAERAVQHLLAETIQSLCGAQVLDGDALHQAATD